MCKKYDIRGWSISNGIQAFHTTRIVLYMRLSNRVVDCNILILYLATRQLSQNTGYTEHYI